MRTEPSTSDADQRQWRYDIVLEYLGAIYYLEEKNYDSDKLNLLLSIKKELFENGLLEINPIFLDYLSNVSIILYGYETVDPFYINIFSKYDFKIVDSDVLPKKLTAYYFDSIEDEISFVCHDIKEKLDRGININDIKLITPSDEYIDPLKRIFIDWSNIPLDIPNKISLYNLPIGKKILECVKNNKSFVEILEIISDSLDNDIKNLIINLFNSYVELDSEVKDLYEMIYYDLKNTFINSKSLLDSIKMVSFGEVLESDYVYLLGFNKENYPKIYKDEDFLNDSEKEKLGLFTSNQNNINSVLELKKNIYSINNLIITYKNKDAFNTYNPSILLEEGFDIIKNPEISYTLSNKLNRITLTREYDKFYKYGIHSDVLDKLNYVYKDLEYRTYDNQFTGLNSDLLIDNLKKPYILSYSSIDDYFRCGFKYYVGHILKIKEEDIDEFYMQIGNIFHYVLSVCFKSDFDFDKSWDIEASKYEFNKSKLIFLDKLKEELKYDISILKKHALLSSFDNAYYEKNFSISIDNTKGISLEFKGIVDKILYREYGNKTLVSIIDYKTGHLPTELNNIIYGIGMQLPIYLYFVKRSSLFPNLEIVGFYLQKIINKEIKRDAKKDVSVLKENALKLVGYSTDNEEYLEKFDISYSDSEMIQGLKKKKEGFYAYSKILNDKQIDKMDKIVSDKIIEASENILDANFKVNPKRIGKDNLGCEYCSYRDICFKKEEDFIELEKHKNLDFLGGE